MGEKKLTDQQLRNFSEEHLHHEIRMVFETACRLRDDVGVHHDIVLKNSVIESFTIHARNVAAFLYPDRPNAKLMPDDVTVDHYVREVGRWRTERGHLPPVLQTVLARTNKEIAHLTTQRHPAGAPEKSWGPEEILQALRRPLSVFVDHAVPERLHSSVSKFIAEQAQPVTKVMPIPVYTTTSTEVARIMAPDSFITDVRTERPGPS